MPVVSSLGSKHETSGHGYHVLLICIANCSQAGQWHLPGTRVKTIPGHHTKQQCAIGNQQFIC
eukprot:scaffold521259_cov24-Prasinocladus_malaysianus.AAC.1